MFKNRKGPKHKPHKSKLFIEKDKKDRDLDRIKLGGGIVDLVSIVLLLVAFIHRVCVDIRLEPGEVNLRVPLLGLLPESFKTEIEALEVIILKSLRSFII